MLGYTGESIRKNQVRYTILIGICNMWWCLLWCSGPLRKFIRALDLIDQQAEFQTDRHTDCTDNGTYLADNFLRVVSSVLCNGLHLNTLMSRCRQTWVGDGWRVWGVGGWESAASIGLLRKMFCLARKDKEWSSPSPPPRLLRTRHICTICLNACDGHFRWWLQPGGRGLMYAGLAPPPPSTDRCRLPKRA